MYHKRDIEQLNEDFAPLIKHFARRYGGEDMAAQLWLLAMVSSCFCP